MVYERSRDSCTVSFLARRCYAGVYGRIASCGAGYKRATRQPHRIVLGAEVHLITIQRATRLSHRPKPWRSGGPDKMSIGNSRNLFYKPPSIHTPTHTTPAYQRSACFFLKKLPPTFTDESKLAGRPMIFFLTSELLCNNFSLFLPRNSYIFLL